MSQANVKKFTFSWEIHNFSLDFYKKNDAIDSPVFEIDSFGGSQWYVRLYPRGESKISGEYFSCYLYKQKNGAVSEEGSLTFQFELIVNEKCLEAAKKENYVHKSNERHGFERFISTSKISTELKSWPGSVLIVRCHLFNIGKQIKHPDFMVQTKVPVNRVLFLWNEKVSNVLSREQQHISKNIVFSEKSLYEITLTFDHDEGYVKVCISQKEESTLPMLVSCKLTLVDSKGKELISKKSTYLFETNEKSDVWEFPSFISEDHFDDENDTFSLFCEFFGSHGINSASKSVNSGSRTTITKCSRTVMQDLKSMLHNRIHTDIKIKTEEQVLHAHKSILSARSPVFSAMFEQNMIESNTGVVEISDLEANVLKLFLDFLYTDTIEDFDYEKAKKLFVVADKYQVTSLAEKCASFLESNLTLANATEILFVADMIGHEHLKEVVMTFVAVNSAIIFNTPEWQDLVAKNVELAGEMISVIASSFKVVPASKLA